METDFYPIDEHRNTQLTYVIIASLFHTGKWIFVRHKERTTWEIPAGHIEAGEHPDTAAKRELYEETGAVHYSISPFMDYSVTKNKVATFGRIYYATIKEIKELPEFEIEEIRFFDNLPQQLTYPEIQTSIFEEIKKRLG